MKEVNKHELRRDLSRFQVLAIVVGSIVGTGIYIRPTEQRAGTLGLTAFSFWLIVSSALGGSLEVLAAIGWSVREFKDYPGISMALENDRRRLLAPVTGSVLGGTLLAALRTSHAPEPRIDAARLQGTR